MLTKQQARLIERNFRGLKFFSDVYLEEIFDSRLWLEYVTGAVSIDELMKRLHLLLVEQDMHDLGYVKPNIDEQLAQAREAIEKIKRKEWDDFLAAWTAVTATRKKERELTPEEHKPLRENLNAYMKEKGIEPIDEAKNAPLIDDVTRDSITYNVSARRVSQRVERQSAGELFNVEVEKRRQARREEIKKTRKKVRTELKKAWGREPTQQEVTEGRVIFERLKQRKERIKIKNERQRFKKTQELLKSEVKYRVIKKNVTQNIRITFDGWWYKWCETETPPETRRQEHLAIVGHEFQIGSSEHGGDSDEEGHELPGQFKNCRCGLQLTRDDKNRDLDTDKEYYPYRQLNWKNLARKEYQKRSA